MSEDEFKKEINIFEREIKRKNPKYILGDPSKLIFPISPDLQDWIAENLFLTISEIEVIKYSIIVAEDLITQLSVEQTVNGGKTGKFIMKYFDDPDKAKNGYWKTKKNLSIQ